MGFSSVYLVSCMTFTVPWSLDVSVGLQGVRRYVNNLSIKQLGEGEAVIVLGVLGVNITFSLGNAFCLICWKN